MKVKELKQALAALGSAADDMDFEVWLPGSTIYLAAPSGNPPTPFFRYGKVMIEGNVTPGSALDGEPDR
jgi:hypothetical protein